MPPNIILVEANDDITGAEYAFVAPKGLLSDIPSQHPGRLSGHHSFPIMKEFIDKIMTESK